MADAGGPLVLPGVYDGLSARIAVQAGFGALVVGGYSVSASRLGMPDYGFLTQTEITDAARDICAAVPGVPVVVDADTGYGNALSAARTARLLHRAGAAGMILEDQEWPKRCGHMAGKRIVPAADWLAKIRAVADLREDGVDLFLIARTDALAADLITSDIDPRDAKFATGERTSEGFFRVRNGVEPVIERGLAYAPYCDLIWVETGTPDLGLAREFAQELHKQHPGKMLAYNCSPSFNWKAALSDKEIAEFQNELGALGYKFQFITLAGFHSLNYGMFDLAQKYATAGMTAYVELQEAEFAGAKRGYTAVKHQAEVGTGYFDLVATAINPESGTLALSGSTEEEQFH
jgi:isocitrate lyase